MSEITQGLALNLLIKKILQCDHRLKTLAPFLTGEMDELIAEKNSYLQHLEKLLEGRA